MFFYYYFVYSLLYFILLYYVLFYYLILYYMFILYYMSILFDVFIHIYYRYSRYDMIYIFSHRFTWVSWTFAPPRASIQNGPDGQGPWCRDFSIGINWLFLWEIITMGWLCAEGGAGKLGMCQKCQPKW
jgi:hypothetical protein